MPCYDGRDNNEKIVYTSGVDPAPYNQQIYDLTAQVNRLEAGLCAIITELEKRGIASEVIAQASTNGQIDLMGFWQKHSKDDEARLAKNFNKFSEHEKEVIRRLIKEGKL